MRYCEYINSVIIFIMYTGSQRRLPAESAPAGVTNRADMTMLRFNQLSSEESPPGNTSVPKATREVRLQCP